MKKVAIAGFGRIGRLAFKELINSDDYEVVAITTRRTNEEMAYLLKYDTTHGSFYPDLVSFDEEGLFALGKHVKIVNPTDNSFPWKELEVDIVLECTGAYTKLEDARIHIEKGAKHVVLSSPGQGDMKTIVYGVNDEILDGEEVISASSCTTNALAPVLKVIHDNLGIVSGYMTTVHSYTNDQNTLDNTHSKGIYRRRGRAAAENIVPTSTGATTSINNVLPQLEGRLKGLAIRVPVANGSCIDLTLNVSKLMSKEEINKLIKDNESDVLKLEEDPIVSSDIIGVKTAAVVDANTTDVNEINNTVKLLIWYDNEAGYTAQLIKTMDALVKSTK